MFPWGLLRGNAEGVSIFFPLVAVGCRYPESGRWRCDGTKNTRALTSERSMIEDPSRSSPLDVLIRYPLLVRCPAINITPSSGSIETKVETE
jgi:hypothetical protein